MLDDQGRQVRPLEWKDTVNVPFEETVRLYPLSYYTLLALNRLRESYPDRFAAAGCGYFLMNPIGDPADERDQIEAIAADILPRLPGGR